MKVKVLKTGEIIDVVFSHTLNSGGDVVNIYADSFTGKLYHAELLEPINEKMVSLDKAVKWLERYASDYAFSIYDEDDACSVDDRLIEDFKRAMLEE